MVQYLPRDNRGPATKSWGIIETFLHHYTYSRNGFLRSELGLMTNTDQKDCSSAYLNPHRDHSQASCAVQNDRMERLAMSKRVKSFL
jgi:hypothetical protein